MLLAGRIVVVINFKSIIAMRKRKSSLVVLPEMVVMQPTVVNVSNAVADVSTEGVDEGFNLSLAEDLQNEIVSDRALKVGVLRSKLEKIESFGDFDNREDGK
jgi:hypothetical protein